ncbi:MAG: SDR family NAD(P)-dependent oxidoreductase, partial [Stellaceae bacterium]
MADFDLKERVALVTGASRGLGRHFAGVLARAGASVVLAARDESRLAEAVAEIGKTEGKIVALPLDVTDGRSVRQCVAAAEAAVGPIDILVN